MSTYKVITYISIYRMELSIIALLLQHLFGYKDIYSSFQSLNAILFSLVNIESI